MSDVLIRICRLQKKNILFRNPNVQEGQSGPNVTFRDEYVYNLCVRGNFLANSLCLVVAKKILGWSEYGRE